MEQLSLDLGITNIDDAMTDRQTAEDAGGENRQGKEGSNSCGRYE